MVVAMGEEEMAEAEAEAALEGPAAGEEERPPR